MKYVAKTDRRFDVIIVDSTDPQGPGKVLFSEKFYAACKRCMTKGGVMVTQNGVPILQSGELTAASGSFASCSPTVLATWRRSRPMWAATWPSAGPPTTPLRQASVKTIADRYRKAGSFATKYWTPEVHKAAFALPRFIADSVTKA